LAKAYLLINAEIGAERDVLNDVSRIPEVKEAYMVYGVYDVVTVVEAATMEELRDVIGRRIRRVGKVRSTTTMVVL
jgi:DNA-binding Lrp family transcriptional regulator